MASKRLKSLVTRMTPQLVTQGWEQVMSPSDLIAGQVSFVRYYEPQTVRECRVLFKLTIFSNAATDVTQWRFVRCKLWEANKMKLIGTWDDDTTSLNDVAQAISCYLTNIEQQETARIVKQKAENEQWAAVLAKERAEAELKRKEAEAAEANERLKYAAKLRLMDVVDAAGIRAFEKIFHNGKVVGYNVRCGGRTAFVRSDYMSTLVNDGYISGMMIDCNGEPRMLHKAGSLKHVHMSEHPDTKCDYEIIADLLGASPEIIAKLPEIMRVKITETAKPPVQEQESEQSLVCESEINALFEALPSERAVQEFAPAAVSATTPAPVKTVQVEQGTNEQGSVEATVRLPVAYSIHKTGKVLYMCPKCHTRFGEDMLYAKMKYCYNCGSLQDWERVVERVPHEKAEVFISLSGEDAYSKRAKVLDTLNDYNKAQHAFCGAWSDI